MRADQEKLDARENDDVAAEMTREVLDATRDKIRSEAGKASPVAAKGARR